MEFFNKLKKISDTITEKVKQFEEIGKDPVFICADLLHHGSNSDKALKLIVKNEQKFKTPCGNYLEKRIKKSVYNELPKAFKYFYSNLDSFGDHTYIANSLSDIKIGERIYDISDPGIERNNGVWDSRLFTLEFLYRLSNSSVKKDNYTLRTTLEESYLYISLLPEALNKNEFSENLVRYLSNENIKKEVVFIIKNTSLFNQDRKGNLINLLDIAMAHGINELKKNSNFWDEVYSEAGKSFKLNYFEDIIDNEEKYVVQIKKDILKKEQDQEAQRIKRIKDNERAKRLAERKASRKIGLEKSWEILKQIVSENQNIAEIAFLEAQLELIRTVNGLLNTKNVKEVPKDEFEPIITAYNSLIVSYKKGRRKTIKGNSELIEILITKHVAFQKNSNSMMEKMGAFLDIKEIFEWDLYLNHPQAMKNESTWLKEVLGFVKEGIQTGIIDYDNLKIIFNAVKMRSNDLSSVIEEFRKEEEGAFSEM